jgi:hypothetical protein
MNEGVFDKPYGGEAIPWRTEADAPGSPPWIETFQGRLAVLPAMAGVGVHGKPRCGEAIPASGLVRHEITAARWRRLVMTLLLAARNARRRISRSSTATPAKPAEPGDLPICLSSECAERSQTRRCAILARIWQPPCLHSPVILHVARHPAGPGAADST